MRAPLHTAAPVANVGQGRLEFHGRNARTISLGTVRKDTDGTDSDATRAAVARLYGILFDGRTTEEMDYRAAVALSISPDQARRIRLKRSGTRDVVILTMIEIAAGRGMADAEILRTLRRGRVKV